MSNTLYNEQYRPQYHVTPKENWLNDPNGMVYYKGEYHLFFQLDPTTKFPGVAKWWGHVASKDMAHWEDRPIALAPDKYGSMWSGSAVVDFNNSSGLFDDSEDKTGLVAFYTVTTDDCSSQQQALAYSKDNGNTWIKYNDGAPIITYKDDPCEEPNQFRDPKVFWHAEGNKWIMVVAGGPVRFYSSTDLLTWTIESTNRDINTECPDFFCLPVDNDNNNKKWVLSGCGVWYMLGDFKEIDGKFSFVPDTGERIRFNYAPDVYAAQTFSDVPDGRRIKVDWMVDVGYVMETGEITDPWNGALTLPYELGLKTVDDKIVLTQKPVKELYALRFDTKSFSDVKVNESSDNLLAGEKLDNYEITATIDVGTAEEFGFNLFVGQEEYTKISYTAATNTLTIDRTKSGKSPKPEFLSAYSAKILPTSNKIELHMFVDRSSIELFAQDGAYPFTALVYPDLASTGLEFYAKGGEVTVDSMNLHYLESIYDSQNRMNSAWVKAKNK